MALLRFPPWADAQCTLPTIRPTPPPSPLQKAHRIHIPIVTHGDVSFEVCPGLEKKRARKSGPAHPSEADEPNMCVSIPMAEGMVFELNNRVLHRVFNRSPVKRVQLVVDVAETPRSPRTLKAGTTCNYVHTVIQCPKSAFVDRR